MFVFSIRRRHTSCALVTGVQTCALPISATSTLGGSALHTWTFTTAEPAVEGQRQTLFGSVVPAVASAADSDAVEVGTAFTVARTGQVTALRFYRGAGNSGSHRGILWGTDGQELARVKIGRAHV